MPNDGDKLKQKQEQGKNAMRNQALAKGAEVAATAFAGPAGGKAVKALSKTQLGKDVLNKAGNNLENKMGNQFGGNKNGSNQSNPLSNLNPMNRMLKGGGLGLAGGLLGQKKEEKSAEENVEEGESSQTQEEQAPSVQIASTLKKYGKIALPFIGVGGVGCLLMGIATIVVILYILSPIFAINNAINKISDGLEKSTEAVKRTFGSFFEGVSNLAKCGTIDEKKCDAQMQNDFYDYVEKISDDYYEKYKVRIDTSLIVATLTYYDTENTLTGEDGEETLDENSNVVVDSSESGVKTDLYHFIKSKLNVRELATQMISDAKKQEIKENVYDSDGNQEFEADKVTPKTKTTTKITYSLDLDKYKKYLTDKWIKDYYFAFKDDAETNAKIKLVIEDIYNRVAFYRYLMNERNAYTKSYASCSGVTVEYNGVIETVTLEDYVNGVVAGELYDSDNIEAKKAMAIAARTFVLSETKNCSIAAGNGASFQNYDPSRITDTTTQATEETAGMILVYDGAIFTSQYDSFCYNDSDCPDSVKNSDGTYTVSYTRQPDLEEHQITLKDPSLYNRIVQPESNHSHGMSQLVAEQMAREGSTFEEILKFFYSDGVEISQMSTIVNVVNADIGKETGKDGLVEVIDGVFHHPSNDIKQAGTEGTRGSGTIFNAGFNVFFEARLNAFVTAAKTEGITILIPSEVSGGAYRTIDQQAYFYCCYTGEGSSKGICSGKGTCNNGNMAAAPGTGNHGWGLAVDLDYNFNSSGRAKAVAWAHEHAADFQLNFPIESEDWHMEPTTIIADLTSVEE